jgi:uncharacterized protein YoxC
LTAASIAAVAVYLIFALRQLTKAAKEIEEAASKVNHDIDVFNKISGKAAAVTEKLAAPLISAGMVIYYVFSAFRKRKNGSKEEKNV